MADAEAAVPLCPNCAAALGDPAPRFCPHCGQETRVRAPTLMEFVQQFGGAYFSTEGALWRTLRLLLVRPGELTRQYLAGRRKHYVLPLRLYLTISLLVLLAIRLLAQSGTDGLLKVDMQLDKPGTRNTFTLDIGHGRAGLKDGNFFCTDLPEWVCHRLQRRLHADPKAMQRELLSLGERIVERLGSAMFVLLPSFALWLKLAFVDRRLRYTEHLVFALHLHAFWFLALALSLPDQAWLSALAFTSMPVYAMLAFKRVYGGGFWSRIARGTLVATLYLLTLVAVTVGLALWALLF